MSYQVLGNNAASVNIRKGKIIYKKKLLTEPEPELWLVKSLNRDRNK